MGQRNLPYFPQWVIVYQINAQIRAKTITPNNIMHAVNVDSAVYAVDMTS